LEKGSESKHNIERSTSSGFQIDWPPLSLQTVSVPTIKYILNTNSVPIVSISFKFAQ
jgi:hypothetical protein